MSFVGKPRSVGMNDNVHSYKIKFDWNFDEPMRNYDPKFWKQITASNVKVSNS